MATIGKYSIEAYRKKFSKNKEVSIKYFSWNSRLNQYFYVNVADLDSSFTTFKCDQFRELLPGFTDDRLMKIRRDVVFIAGTEKQLIEDIETMMTSWYNNVIHERKIIFINISAASDNTLGAWRTKSIVDVVEGKNQDFTDISASLCISKGILVTSQVIGLGEEKHRYYEIDKWDRRSDVTSRVKDRIVLDDNEESWRYVEQLKNIFAGFVKFMQSITEDETKSCIRNNVFFARFAVNAIIRFNKRKITKNSLSLPIYPFAITFEEASQMSDLKNDQKVEK